MGLSQHHFVSGTTCFPPNDAIHSVKAHEQGGQCIAFSPYGQQVASGGGDGFVKLWNTQLSPECVQTRASQGFISTLAFNTGGSVLAAADSLYQINLLSVKNSLQHLSKLQGHTDMINTCVFSSEDKRVLISVGQDRSLRIWDLATRQPKKNLSITSVAIALDLNKMDTYFATGHKSGDVKLWSLSD